MDVLACALGTKPPDGGDNAIDSKIKTEYMPTPQPKENIKLEDGPIPKVNVFEYLGSLFAAEGGSETEVNNRVKAA